MSLLSVNTCTHPREFLGGGRKAARTGDPVTLAIKKMKTDPVLSQEGLDGDGKLSG